MVQETDPTDEATAEEEESTCPQCGGSKVIQSPEVDGDMPCPECQSASGPDAPELEEEEEEEEE